MTELLYNGKPMSSDVGINEAKFPLAQFRSVLETSGENHETFQFDLQPGDGTRYCFIVCPIDFASSHGLLFTRLTTSRDVIGSAIIWNIHDASAYEVQKAVESFAPQDKQPWTNTLLSWWFKELFNGGDDA